MCVLVVMFFTNSLHHKKPTFFACKAVRYFLSGVFDTTSCVVFIHAQVYTKGTFIYTRMARSVRKILKSEKSCKCYFNCMYRQSTNLYST